MNKIIPIITILFLLTTCNQRAGKQEHNLDWLIGTWAIEESGGIQTKEVWEKTDIDTYNGYNVSLDENGDTIFSELIEIKKIVNQLYYVVSVPSQNGGLEIRFKLVSTENNKYVFENSEHDFPQRIVYLKVGSDSLHAYIEGMTMGDDSRMDFYFIKQ